MPHFSGHYRQRGSGFEALAAGIGRVALPSARKIIWPAAKRISRELLVHGAPELVEVATKRKSAKQALKGMVAKTARKQFGGSLYSRITRGRQVIKRRRQQYAKPRTYKKRSTKKIISRKPQPRRSRLDFFSRVKMRTNIVIPSKATHSSLDLFEKPPLLVTFDQSFEQKTGPLYSPSGSSLEFEVVGDRNNVIDLQKIYLEVKCRIQNADGTDLRYTAGDATATDAAYFVNNVLHSLFTDCTVSANGIKNSSNNGHYARKNFIEPEFSHEPDAKKTWLKCQSYEYEPNPAGIAAASRDARQVAVRESEQITLYGKLAVEFFSCGKHLVSRVTLRLSFRRSQDDFVLISETAAKNDKVKIDEANLFVRKMTVSDNVVGAIEKTLIKTPAMYRYNEVITKPFLATAGQRSWKHEDIFTKEPIRRLIVALCRSNVFIGTNNINPYHYQKFDLSEITVYRNGFATAGTPMLTNDIKRLFYNSMSALAYVENGHGIPLSDFAHHSIMVFDLTSTPEATHDFIHPELTNSSLSFELKFDTDLPNIKKIFLGEKSSTVYIDSARNVSKNVLPMNAY